MVSSSLVLVPSGWEMVSSAGERVLSSRVRVPSDYAHAYMRLFPTLICTWCRIISFPSLIALLCSARCFHMDWENGRFVCSLDTYNGMFFHVGWTVECSTAVKCSLDVMCELVMLLWCEWRMMSCAILCCCLHGMEWRGHTLYVTLRADYQPTSVYKRPFCMPSKCRMRTNFGTRST